MHVSVKQVFCLQGLLAAYMAVFWNTAEGVSAHAAVLLTTPPFAVRTHSVYNACAVPRSTHWYNSCTSASSLAAALACRFNSSCVQ